MKKGQIYEGVVETVKFPNKGQIVFEERNCVAEDATISLKESDVSAKKTVVQIKNVIPGQRVRFMVSKIRKGRAEARLMEVLEKSPVECESRCRHFEQCGGCTYQNLPYEEQIKLKEGQVRELLDSVVTDYQFEGILSSPVQYEYRNKMEFSFGDEYKGGSLSLGLHKRGSFYDIVTVSDCQIVDADYRKILNETIAYFKEKETPFYHKMTHEGYLRHLLVRKGARTGEILIDLITSSQTPPDTSCM
ncbi:MAG: class I SAM-dependent RNA methyltransferase, partial [Clostridia bacterium]|nr:class I SAM-dependent RNA methyltransferase [Clostridia bacterium]